MLEVRFFARLREALGRERVRLPLETPGLTVEGLLSALEAEIPGSRGQLTAPGIRLAVNQTFVEDENFALNPGDEVAFLPPVTGG
ncbi:MAG: MoaD/ThiS family protein [Pseudomonadales bacterium]|jgi:molybdopterin converting factor subunit 1|nr:MoaD/ThiS family protein [Pseudomonadales bacterium]NBQ10550.1 MoaD/ThiS family protein [Gammaproteobacteria bacterium]